MIRKLIIIITFAIVLSVIGEYYRIIKIPSLNKPAVLDDKDQMIHKTKKEIEDR